MGVGAGVGGQLTADEEVVVSVQVVGFRIKGGKHD